MFTVSPLECNNPLPSLCARDSISLLNPELESRVDRRELALSLLFLLCFSLCATVNSFPFLGLISVQAADIGLPHPLAAALVSLERKRRYRCPTPRKLVPLKLSERGLWMYPAQSALWSRSCPVKGPYMIHTAIRAHTACAFLRFWLQAFHVFASLQG
jgi:hypothetical protein